VSKISKTKKEGRYRDKSIQKSEKEGGGRPWTCNMEMCHERNEHSKAIAWRRKPSWKGLRGGGKEKGRGCPLDKSSKRERN